MAMARHAPCDAMYRRIVPKVDDLQEQLRDAERRRDGVMARCLTAFFHEIWNSAICAPNPEATRSWTKFANGTRPTWRGDRCGVPVTPHAWQHGPHDGAQDSGSAARSSAADVMATSELGGPDNPHVVAVFHEFHGVFCFKIQKWATMLLLRVEVGIITQIELYAGPPRPKRCVVRPNEEYLWIWRFAMLIVRWIQFPPSPNDSNRTMKGRFSEHLRDFLKNQLRGDFF